MPYLSASAVVIHYEEALYQMYAPLPNYRHTCMGTYSDGGIALSSSLCLTMLVGVGGRNTLGLLGVSMASYRS